MLGELISEGRAKTTGTRVLEGGKLEVSIQGTGKLLGVETSEMATYVSDLRPDGTLHGEGQGVSMGKGGEVAMWRGQGVGKPTGRGFGASWRATIFYQTPSPKWARLNSIVAVAEYEVDETGNTSVKEWEWK